MCYHTEFGRSVLKGLGINKEPPKWGATELHSLGMGGVADPKLHAPPHVCYHVKFRSFATKGVRINRREPQNWGSWDPDPLGWGMADS